MTRTISRVGPDKFTAECNLRTALANRKIATPDVDSIKQTRERYIKLSTSQHALYRFYDSNAILLYVGISWSLAQRIAGHRNTKTWWQDVAIVQLEWLPNREAALEAEAVAIKNENPKYNITSIATNDRETPTTIAELRSEPDRLFTAKELATMTGVPINSIIKWTQEGKGPRRLQIEQYTRYRACDIMTWLDQEYSV